MAGWKYPHVRNLGLEAWRLGGLKDLLMSAAAEGHYKCVDTLVTELERRKQASTVKDILNKALNSTAKGGHSEAVKILLERGAYANCEDHNHISYQLGITKTPLIWAVEEGHTETVTVLLQAGCSANWVAENGHSPLLHAAFHGKTQTVTLLLEHGANLRQQDSQGFNALAHASEFGHSETVDTLLKAGINVNSTNGDGQTSLMLACVGGHKETVQVCCHYKHRPLSRNSMVDESSDDVESGPTRKKN